jgi:hypothetical protein
MIYHLAPLGLEALQHWRGFPAVLTMSVPNKAQMIKAPGTLLGDLVLDLLESLQGYI